MKNVILIASLLVCVSCARAQSFTHFSARRLGSEAEVSFTVRKEANIRYYLIEGSKDSLSFDILDRIASAGNTVLPLSYRRTMYDTSYRLYRVRQVDIASAASYSPCFGIKEAAAKPVAPANRNNTDAEQTIAVRQE